MSAFRDRIAGDDRPLAIRMHVIALLGIELRPSDRPLADRAIEACRTALGRERFDQLFARQLFARGENTRWSDLPDVDISAP